MRNVVRAGVALLLVLAATAGPATALAADEPRTTNADDPAALSACEDDGPTFVDVLGVIESFKDGDEDVTYQDVIDVIREFNCGDYDDNT